VRAIVEGEEDALDFLYAQDDRQSTPDRGHDRGQRRARMRHRHREG
jgi:hypothetical protein